MSYSITMRLVVTLSLLSAVALSAQQPASMRLAPSTGTLPEEFTSILGVRELRDGRVLVSDRREKRVVVADFAKGAVEQVGRVGDGPLEYSSAEPVWGIAGDSGILFLTPQRWVLFAGGRISGVLGADADVVRVTRNVVRGVDTLGHVLSGPIYPPASASSPSQGDSVPLQLLSRATAKVDTIVRVWVPVPRRTPFPDRPGFFIFAPPTMSMFESSALAPDGWIAVMRTAPYRVDWRAPDGRWVKGQPIRFPAVAITEREKLFYLEKNPDPSNPKRGPESITDWPATVPAVGNLRWLLIAPDGRVAIQRHPSADHPDERYDIVNRRGGLDGQLLMLPGERIIGFGAKSAYVIHTNSDGIQTLRRHAWPPVSSR